jgi:ABC-2 type transport system permease protein
MEYREGVRTRWFFLSTLLGPVLFLALFMLPLYLQHRVARRPVRVAVVDASPEKIGVLLRDDLSERRGGESARFTVELTASADAPGLGRRVEAGELEGYLVLPANLVHGGEAIYRGENVSSLADMGVLEHALRAAVQHARAQSFGLRDEQLRALLAPVAFSTQQASGKGASGGATFMVAYAVALLLYIAVLLYAIAVMRSVLQEKTNRVMEVIVACARPRDLLFGKVLGVGALGLTQFGIWIAASGFLASQRGAIAERFGIHNAGAFVLPAVGAATLALLVVYFIGGFFLYAAIFAAIGAASNSQQEAQQAQFPVTMLLVGAIMCFSVVTSAPRDAAAMALTSVPFFSPVLMPMRLLLTAVPAWQIALSLAILFGSIALVLAAAARIYRVGILMYGKRPTLGELWRWIRAR